MTSTRLARSVRAIVLATTLALVPTVGAVVVAPAAHADGSKEWTGGGDGHLWSDDKNWSGEEAPQDGDSVTINSPDQNGSTVHVVGVPDISLDSFSVTADGTATVSVQGGSVGVAGSFDWASGTLGVNVNLGPLAHGSIGSGGMKYLQGDISAGIGSALTMSGVSGTSGLMMYDPHTITVGTGAALATLGTNVITAQSCCVAPAKLINHGLVEMGPGSLTLSTVEFDQLGRVDATFGPTLTVTDAPVKIGSNPRFSGTGRLVLGNRSDTITDGKIRIGGSYVVEQSGGVLKGVASLTGGGIWQLTGGTQFGTLTNATGNLFQVMGPAAKSLGVLTSKVRGSIDNHGVLEVSGPGVVTMAAGTKFVNEADGTMRLVPGVTLSGQSCCVLPALLENHGDLTVTAPASESEPVAPATIERAALYSNSPVVISPGQTLELASGPSQLTSPATIGGGGTLGVGDDLIVSGGVAVQAGSTVRLHDAADVTGDGAVFGGSGSTVQWEKGVVRGIVEFPVGTTVNLTGTGDKKVGAPAFGTTRVTTAGTTTIGAGTSDAERNPVGIDAGQRWVNTGALTMHGNTQLSSGSCCVTPARLDNTAGATLDFAPETGTTAGDAGVEVHNLGGVVTATSGTTAIAYPSYVQESGTTSVAAAATFGQTNFSSTMQVRGGSVTGTGTLTGTVDNSGGTIAPGTSATKGTIGTLTLSGQYFQGPGGHLTVDIAAAKGDVVAVGGAVRLAGVVTGVVKGAAPALGATATVITGATLTGAPDCTFTSGSNTRQWASTTTSTALTLTAGATGPTGCDVFTPLNPARIDGTGTTVAPAQDALVQVAGNGGVPATGVDAVALSVSVDSATADGALQVSPATASGEVLHFRAGKPVSSAVIVKLDNQGRVLLHVTGGAATVHLEVAGWYADAQHTTDGALYHPVAPQEIKTVDLTSTKDVDLTVDGKGGIPSSGTTSVTLALELKAGAAAGSLSVLPGGAAAGATTTQSFGAKQTVEALTTVRVHEGTVRLHLSAGTAKVTVRTLGYTAARSAGGSYLKVAGPSRVATFSASESGTVDALGGLGGISQYGAVAYLLTVHAENPSAKGVLAVGSAAADAALVPTAGIVAAHADASGATVTVGNENDAIRLRTGNGTTMVRLDLQAWYVG